MRFRPYIPVAELRTPGTVVHRLRELDALPAGTIAQATSHPAPRYFLRYGAGWLACTRDGDTRLHMDLWAGLDGWPVVLPHEDLRRPVTVLDVPERIPA